MLSKAMNGQVPIFSAIQDEFSYPFGWIIIGLIAAYNTYYCLVFDYLDVQLMFD